MKQHIIILILLLSFLLNYNSFASVEGPTEFHLIGYDTSLSYLYFSRYNANECDCPVELWIYKTKEEKFEINKNWAEKLNFWKKKDSIIKDSGLEKLINLDPVNTDDYDFFQINWLAPQRRYDRVVMDSVDYFPYEFIVNDSVYLFSQWFEKKQPPIRLYLLEEINLGIIIITPNSRLSVEDKIIFFIPNPENDQAKNDSIIGKEITDFKPETENTDNCKKKTDSKETNYSYIIAIISMLLVIIIVRIIRRKRNK